MNKSLIIDTSHINMMDFSIIKSGQSSNNRQLPQFSRINLIIGENNSGKSRLLRELAKSEVTEPFEESDHSSSNNHSSEAKKTPAKYYIPILRGLRGFTKAIAEILEKDLNSSGNRGITDNFKDIYLIRTVRDYFNNKESGCDNLKIFTGLEMYEKTRDMILGDLRERKIIEEYEQFLSNEFFEGQDVELIPKTKDDVLYIRIGNDEEHPIYELGDGIQALIVITFPIFLEKDNPAAFFIEKPETYLHPGIQKKLFKIISEGNCSSKHTYVITTHSQHLLEVAGDYPDISVFKMKKSIGNDDSDSENIPVFSVERVFFTGEKVADLPGIINPSLYLPNCLIWVRGSAEKYYMRKILEEYQNHFFSDDEFRRFQEDINFLFIEFGKDDISRMILHGDSFFASHIEKDECPNAAMLPPSFLVAGRRREEEVSAFRELIEESGGGSYLYQANRIENLMPLDTVIEIIREYEGEDFQLKIKPDDYKRYPNELLGNFIEERFFGFSLFKEESEILDWDAFLKSLEEPRDKAREHLWDFLDTECQRQINYRQIDVKSRYLFINDFNSILKNKNFYDKEAFKNAELSDEIKFFLNRGINQLVRYEIQKLNRLLLEAMYPQIIKKKKDIEAENPRCKRSCGYADNMGLLSISPIRFVRQVSSKLGPSFIPSDIINWKSFLKTLKLHKNSDVERIWNFLDSETRNLINRLDIKEDPDIKDKRNIINAFNQLLNTREIYDRKVFEAGRLLKNYGKNQVSELKNYSQEKLRRFNRSLLVMTFPQEIRPAFDKLNRESKDLAKKLYEFIREHNM